MPHDDSNKCKEDGVKIQQHVMAPTLNYNTNPWMWSKCSRKYITEFLEYVAPFYSRRLHYADVVFLVATLKQHVLFSNNIYKVLFAQRNDCMFYKLSLI